MSEPEAKVEVEDAAAVADGSGPPEGSGVEAVTEKKDAEENDDMEEAKVKDRAGENDANDVVREVKGAAEIKGGNEKDDVLETKEVDASNCTEVEKNKDNNGAKEMKDNTEEMKNVEQQDSVEEMKNEEEKENVEEEEEKEDNNEVGNSTEVAKGEGEDEKETKDVEMTEAENVKDEKEMELAAGGTEDGMEVENKDDMKEEEEGGNAKEVDEKERKVVKKKRGKRSKPVAKREPQEKKEGGKKEKKEGDNKEKKIGEKRTKDSSYTRTPPTIERPVRERKTVERLVEVIEKEPNKRVIIEKGRGTPLKDIPNDASSLMVLPMQQIHTAFEAIESSKLLLHKSVRLYYFSPLAYKIARKKPSDLKLLHQTLFGRIGKAADFKHHILQFSGFVWHEDDEKQRAKIKEKLDKCVKDSLLDLCDLLDLSVSKTNTKKEDLLVKLLNFLAAPNVTTDVILAEKDQQTPNSRKRKRFSGGSPSMSSEETVVKQSKNKRRKSEGTPSNKEKGAQDTEGEDESEDEDNNNNGMPEEDEELGDSDSEKENRSDDVASAEDDSEDSGQGKETTKVPSKLTGSSGNKKMKVGSDSKKVSLVTSAKSTTKRPSTGKSTIKTPLIGKNPTRARTTTHSSKSNEINEAGEKVFVRKKKKIDSPMEISASKSDIKEKSTGKKVEKGKPKLEEEGQSGPRTAQLRKTICEILTKVDFNKATFTDILKRLETQYKVDLTARKSSLKQIIKEELTKLADASEEDEEDAGEEDNPKPTSKGIKA